MLNCPKFIHKSLYFKHSMGKLLTTYTVWWISAKRKYLHRVLRERNKVTFDHAFSSMYMSNPLFGSSCDIFHLYYWCLFTYQMVSGSFCILTEQVQNNVQPLIG